MVAFGQCEVDLGASTLVSPTGAWQADGAAGFWDTSNMKSLIVNLAACLIFGGFAVEALVAQSPSAAVPLAASDAGPANAPPRNPAFRLPWEDAEDAGAEPATAGPRPDAKHPLYPALEYAAHVIKQIHNDVRDYECVIIKRERIEDELQDFQTMRARVRCNRAADADQPAVPLSVYLEFLGPPKVRGRRVLFVAGENSGKMLARNGGKHFNYVIVKLDPRSEAAMKRESGADHRDRLREHDPDPDAVAGRKTSHHDPAGNEFAPGVLQACQSQRSDLHADFGQAS